MEKIQILSTYEQFLSLQENWNDILHRSNSDTIFLTFEWIKAWIDNFLDQDELFIITVSNEKSEILGIAPLCIRKLKAYGFLPMKALVFLGDRDAGSEYLDFIIVKGYEDQIIHCIFQFLRKNEKLYDFLFLKEIPELSLNLNLTESHSKKVGFRSKKVKRICSEIKLPDSWEEYLRMHSPRRRKKIRAARRKLLEQYEVKFHILDRDDDIDDLLIALFRLHQKRWVRFGKSGSFYRIEKRTFYRDVSHQFLKKGWLMLSYLEIDGEIRACQFSFLYNNEIKHLQEGFDPDWEEKEIGNVLRGYVIENLIRIGVSTYDFLGGLTFHKSNWGAQEKYSYNLTLIRRRNLKNIFFDLLSKMKKFYKNILLDSIKVKHQKRFAKK